MITNRIHTQNSHTHEILQQVWKMFLRKRRSWRVIEPLIDYIKRKFFVKNYNKKWKMVLYYFTCCMYDRFWGLIFFSCWKLSPKWFWNIIYLSENLSQHINSVYRINENVYYAHETNFIVASIFELQMSRRSYTNVH